MPQVVAEAMAELVTAVVGIAAAQVAGAAEVLVVPLTA